MNKTNAKLEGVKLAALLEKIRNFAEWKKTQDRQLDESMYAIEEMSELIAECSAFQKSVVKQQRNGSIKDNIFDESCDVLCTLLVYLAANGMLNIDKINKQIEFKMNRCVERAKKGTF